MTLTREYSMFDVIERVFPQENRWINPETKEQGRHPLGGGRSSALRYHEGVLVFYNTFTTLSSEFVTKTSLVTASTLLVDVIQSKLIGN